MSPTTRWIIAIIGGVCALSFAGVALVSAPGDMNIGALWGIAGFCALITVVCFPGKARAVAVRLLAAAIFCVAASYAYSEIAHPMRDPVTYRRSSVSSYNALRSLIFFGLPSAYVTIFGRLPTWNRFGRMSSEPTGSVIAAEPRD